MRRETGVDTVAFHGHPRFTGDINVFVRPSAENATRVLNALDRFGFRDHGVAASDLVEPGRIVQLGHPPNRIDVLVGTGQGSASATPGSRGLTTLRRKATLTP